MVGTRTGSYRPPVMGVTHAVSSGHYLASAAGYRILEQGGNAVDAGVAASIAINVLLPDMTSFGGVAPIMIYDATADSVSTISGLGRWPRKATREHFVDNRGGDIPIGVERIVVPAAAGAWLTALEEDGTLSFEQVVTPALELARDGFPLHYTGELSLNELGDQFGMWPSSAAVFAPNGQPLRFGDKLVQSALASTFQRMIDMERSASGRGREGAIAAARDLFYTGEIGEEIVEFVQEGGGFLTMEDMAEFKVGHESPAVGTMGEHEVFTCGPWCQGPMLAEAVNILATDDLHAMGHNTADYIHLLSESLNMAFADRDAYIGDPDFVDVPMDGLMSAEFASERRAAIDQMRASGRMPLPGDPWKHEGRSAPPDYAYVLPTPVGGGIEPDTSYVCVIDRWGNAYSATPSDTLSGTPIIPSLGFTPSGRGSQNWLDADHPSSLEPWKRPRLTPNPAMAFKDGKLLMPFGTPGGDTQPQTMLQVFLNIAVFGMNAQEAIEAPRFQSQNFPNSFWPHAYLAGSLRLEGRIGSEIGGVLEQRGHDISWMGTYDAGTGSCCAITVDRDKGTITAGADYRRESYAIGR